MMKFNVDDITEDWRDWTCGNCNESVEKAYRVSVSSEMEDDCGNALMTSDTELCAKCIGKKIRNWKSILEKSN